MTDQTDNRGQQQNPGQQQQERQGGNYEPAGDRGVQFEAEQGQEDISFEEAPELDDQLEQGESGQRNRQQQQQEPGQQQQEEQAGQSQQPDESGSER